MDFDPLPQQRAAIEAPLGPVLVVAGPGAGKTFCLIGRVSHLIEVLGFPPARICAVTFTNKAAEEIAVRLRRTLGDRAEEVTRGTLHALCLGILREHAEAAGLRKGFGVADEQYQRVVLRRLNVHLKRRGTLLTLFSRRRLQQYPLTTADERSEEHTSELQSPYDLVCRLLLEKKKKKITNAYLTSLYRGASMALRTVSLCS